MAEHKEHRGVLHHLIQGLLGTGKLAVADQELVSNQFCQVVLEDRKMATRTEKAWDPGQFARSAVGRRETDLASWAPRERFQSKRFLPCCIGRACPFRCAGCSLQEVSIGT